MAELLSVLFDRMRADPMEFVQAGKGSEFEDRILFHIKSLGYGQILSTDVPNAAALKPVVLEKTTDLAIPNITQLDSDVIYHPYGSQQYPDFLVFTDTRVLPLEVKFGKGKRPVWNSGLPRPNGFYIFGSSNHRQITFFRGIDVISKEEAAQLHEFFKERLREQEQFNRTIRNQSYGFSAYIRKAFDQRLKYNQDAIIDFFGNPNRQQLEEKVIEDVDLRLRW